MHQHASLRISPSRPTVVMVSSVPLRRTGSLVSAHSSPRTDRSRDEGERLNFHAEACPTFRIPLSWTPPTDSMPGTAAAAFDHNASLFPRPCSRSAQDSRDLVGRCKYDMYTH